MLHIIVSRVESVENFAKGYINSFLVLFKALMKHIYHCTYIGILLFRHLEVVEQLCVVYSSCDELN